MFIIYELSVGRITCGHKFLHLRAWCCSLLHEWSGIDATASVSLTNQEDGETDWKIVRD